MNTFSKAEDKRHIFNLIKEIEEYEGQLCIFSRLSDSVRIHDIADLIHNGGDNSCIFEYKIDDMRFRLDQQYNGSYRLAFYKVLEDYINNDKSNINYKTLLKDVFTMAKNLYPKEYPYQEAILDAFLPDLKELFDGLTLEESKALLKEMQECKNKIQSNSLNNASSLDDACKNATQKVNKKNKSKDLKERKNKSNNDISI